MNHESDIDVSLNRTSCEINAELIDNRENITQLVDNEVSPIVYLCHNILSQKIVYLS